MDQDQKSDGSEETLERIASLGFKPQKEIIYNRLLPYSKHLDEESAKLFAEIKSSLGRAVILQDLRPGCVLWATRLSKYIRLHGLKFSKEDHIALVHLLYQLVTIPNLEPWLVVKFSDVLITLLKKKELLSPDDIELPWRPLYKLYHRLFYSSDSTIGILRCSSSLERSVKPLAQSCKPYFPVSATREMLDEWRPLLCPFNVSMCKAVNYLDMFLPVMLKPEDADKGYRLWFDELLGIWSTCHNSPNWENNLLWLFTKLASQNVGYIDWNPYIPMFFTRFLRSFNLPVSYKQMNSSRNSKLDASGIGLWVASVLGGGSCAQQNLDKLLKAVESYVHPANFGAWYLKLKVVLLSIVHHVVDRVNRERYRKPSWETPTPKSHRLTDADIEAFVTSMKPVAMQAMFCKIGVTEANQTLQKLALLAPHIIIPSMLERLYSTLDSVTEPHKLTTLLHCVGAVARPLVSGGGGKYPEGPTHVVPLLMSTLPGIDPNDLYRCFFALQFIVTIVSLVPLVDCSGAVEHWPDLTKDEQTACLATAGFEDFVLQFMDRCFSLIENTTLENTRMDRESEKRSWYEQISEVALASTFAAVIMQTSNAIFKSALQKLKTFITGHILETKVAGRSAATVCRTFCRANPTETLKALVPHLTRMVLNLTSSDDILKEEILDNELLYNMLVLSEIVECPGNHVLPFVPQLEKVLDRTLHLTSREGYLFAGSLLRHILRSLSVSCPTEFRSSTKNYDAPAKEFLALKEWGKPSSAQTLDVKWYVPGKEEFKCVNKLVTKYLQAELDTLEKYIAGEITLKREEIQCSLSIILDIILGAGTVLPPWEEEPVKLVGSNVSVLPQRYMVMSEPMYVQLSDGRNARKTIADMLDNLILKLNKTAEDDTKSFFHIIDAYHSLLFYWGVPKEFLEAHWKSFRMVKKSLEDRVVGRKRHVRCVLIDRVALQHESRLRDAANVAFTPTHQKIFENLLELSTSQYSEVRSKAQTVLSNSINQFPYSFRIVIPRLAAILRRKEDLSHEQLKGALYLALGTKTKSLLARHDWKAICELWPSIVHSQPSEKPSVVRLLENIEDFIQENFNTLTISVQFTDQCFQTARHFWDSSLHPPSQPLPTTEEVTIASSRLQESNAESLKLYSGLVNDLLDSIESGNLHWRYFGMAVNILNSLVHIEVPYSARAVRLFLNLLIHDTLDLRKTAIQAVMFIFRQQKRDHEKLKVDPYSFASGNNVKRGVICPGDREDNAWLQYDSKSKPVTAEAWNAPRFLHKTYYGFYAWPKELEVYAPCSKQPPIERDVAALNPQEVEVHNFMSNQESVDRLIKFLSLEERKGKDKFGGRRFAMFKGLFRNHGDTYLAQFKPHLERLVADSQESSQRCAAEIVAGIIRGSKHWPYEKVDALWKFLEPLVRTALSNMTVETVADWGTCFATASENRDPNRHHWLLELLMEDPLRDEASYIEAGRLYVLQGGLGQQEWRVAELLHRLLAYLKPFLTHPYQNVRTRLGSVLTNIFLHDIVLPNGTVSRSPHIEDFVSEILPQLVILQTEVTAVGDVKKKNHVKDEKCPELMRNLSLNDAAKETAFRLLKTVCQWIINSVYGAQFAAIKSFFEFFPLLCLLESYEGDEELSHMCTVSLGFLAKSLIVPQYMSMILNSVNKVTKSSSWRARAACLDFMQVAVFHNMFIVLSRKEWVDQVINIVLNLLGDDRLEVREKAAQVLGGLFHCGFLSTTPEILKRFKTQSATKWAKKKLLSDPENIEAIVARHSGILGLCALVNAYPYDVPEFVPDVLMELGDHLNDPQPIPGTIRKTLSNFKRTHHDNWQDHKLKFSDDQLVILTDLLVSPSYYA